MKIFNITIAGKAWKIFFIASAFSIMLASVYLYALMNIEQKKQHTSELASDIEALAGQKENLKSVKKNVSETVAVRDELDNYFVPKDGVVKFLNLLQSLGNENHLALKVNSVGIEAAPLSPDIFEMIGANLEVSGTWPNVYRFASLVEMLPFKVYLHTVNLAKVSDKSVGSSPLAWKGMFTIGVLKLK